MVAPAEVGAQVRSQPDQLQPNESDSAVEGRLRLAVYLPDGYSEGSKRYPVVYFLHGLPAAASSYRGADFLARALESSGRKAIIVAPQGARDGDSDPEYLDWGTGRNWETAITRDVVHYVDSHLRTIPNRRGRAIVGLSAGGYGAVILALHHLEAFSVMESWSGSFHPTTRRRRALDLGSAQANAKAGHSYVGTLKRLRASPDVLCVLRRPRRPPAPRTGVSTGAHSCACPHLFRVYHGGHEQSVWSARASLARACRRPSGYRLKRRLGRDVSARLLLLPCSARRRSAASPVP